MSDRIKTYSAESIDNTELADDAESDVLTWECKNRVINWMRALVLGDHLSVALVPNDKVLAFSFNTSSIDTSYDELCADEKHRPAVEQTVLTMMCNPYNSHCEFPGIASLVITGRVNVGDGRWSKLDETMVVPSNHCRLMVIHEHKNVTRIAINIAIKKVGNARPLLPHGIYNFTPNTCKCCQNCGKISQTVLTCAKCKIATYCDKNCQLIAWKTGHKKKCVFDKDVIAKMNIGTPIKLFEQLYPLVHADYSLLTSAKTAISENINLFNMIVKIYAKGMCPVMWTSQKTVVYIGVLELNTG